MSQLVSNLKFTDCINESSHLCLITRSERTLVVSCVKIEELSVLVWLGREVIVVCFHLIRLSIAITLSVVVVFQWLSAIKVKVVISRVTNMPLKISQLHQISHLIYVLLIVINIVILEKSKNVKDYSKCRSFDKIIIEEIHLIIRISSCWVRLYKHLKGSKADDSEMHKHLPRKDIYQNSKLTWVLKNSLTILYVLLELS